MLVFTYYWMVRWRKIQQGSGEKNEVREKVTSKLRFEGSEWPNYDDIWEKVFQANRIADAKAWDRRLSMYLFKEH